MTARSNIITRRRGEERRVGRMCAVALLVAASDLLAQAATVPVRTLSSPEIELSQPFTRIVGIRELSDGRAIVVDGGEKIVALVDFARRSISKIGREGAGPGEYSSPTRILPARGDTTIIGDLTGHLIKIAIRLPSSASICAPAKSIPRRGSVPPMIEERTRNGGGISPGGRPEGPYVAQATWIVAPDGRIAIVLPAPYQVTWFSTSGQRITGQPIAFQRVPVTSAEKQAYRDNYPSSPNMSMSKSMDQSGGVTSVSSRPMPFREPRYWPGFGQNGAVYVVRWDDDDLQYLQRFRIR